MLLGNHIPFAVSNSIGSGIKLLKHIHGRLVLIMGLSCENATALFSLGGQTVCIELSADSRGLTACRLLEIQCEPTEHIENPFLKDGVQVLGEYFVNGSSPLDCTLAPDGTPFQKKVWTAALSIPPGEVRSYRWLAEQVGNPRAVRAAAGALGANPLLLFVPCHRVLQSNGGLGGFACGVHVKEQLLAHEGVLLPLATVPLATI